MTGFNVLERLRLRHLLFVTLTLVSVIPVLMLEVWVGRSAEQNEFDAIADKHVLLANNLTESLNRYVIDVSGVFSYAANSLANGAANPPLRELLSQLHFRHLCILDNNGKLVNKVLTSQDLGEIQLHDQLQRLLGSDVLPGSVSFSDVSPGSGGRPAIFIGLRLSPDRVAIGELSTDYMQQLQREITFGEMGHAAIVDASGRLLAHPRGDWAKEMKNLSKLAPVQRMMAGETGVSLFYSPATKLDMVAGYSTVPGVGWGVMIPQPVYELYDRAREVTHMSTQILIAGILIAALLSWWVAGYLSGPIIALTKSARCFKPGASNTAIELDGLVPSELRTLTESFNSMMENVSATGLALQQKSEVLQITLDNMVEGITLVDEHQRLLVANRQFQKFFDFDARQLEEAPELCDLQLAHCADDQGADLFAEHSTKPLELVHCNGRVIELRNNRLPGGQLVTSYTDVTERNQADEDVRYLASHDALTGLPNRFKFCNRLEQIVETTLQDGGTSALHYIDLDQFKDINDTQGHNVGDLLSLEVGKRLQSCLGAADFVGRLGGDEFGIVQTGIRCHKEASALAQKVIDVVSAPYLIEDRELYVGATVGIIEYRKY